MGERTGVITFQGNPLTLAGNEVSVGDKAPDFTVLSNDLTEVSPGDFAGKTLLISSVPSLDTPVCDAETKRFNDEAIKLGDAVEVLTISMDLPFAQARWCQANRAENISTLSDYRDASFGNAFGMLIKELRLLARAIFIVDKAGVVQYIQIVPEIAQEPDYDAVLEALGNIL